PPAVWLDVRTSLNQLPLLQRGQILGHVSGNIGLIALAQDRRDLGHGALAVYQLQDGRAGLVQEHGTLGIEQDSALANRIVVESCQPPEPRHRILVERHAQSSRYAL